MTGSRTTTATLLKTEPEVPAVTAAILTHPNRKCLPRRRHFAPSGAEASELTEKKSKRYSNRDGLCFIVSFLNPKFPSRVVSVRVAERERREEPTGSARTSAGAALRQEVTCVSCAGSAAGSVWDGLITSLPAHPWPPLSGGSGAAIRVSRRSAMPGPRPDLQRPTDSAVTAP